MRFASAAWLWLLALLPLLALAGWWAHANRRAALQRFACWSNGRKGPVRFRTATTVRNFAAAAICASLTLYRGAAPSMTGKPNWMSPFGKLATGPRARSRPITASGMNVMIGLASVILGITRGPHCA